MSHLNYTPKRRTMSMAELNHAKTLNNRLEKHLRSIAALTGEERLLSQAERVHYCSTYWQGFYCPSCGKYHDMHTTGCKHRLCPICATRASRVTAMQAMEAIQLIKQESPEVQLSLLTLTQQNVQGEELANEISRMLDGWWKLGNSKTFRKRVYGWARTIEIVPALANDGTYHPHIHAILLHFGDIPDISWFISHWRSSMALNYQPICDIRPVMDVQGSVFEVSKYVSKLTRVYDNSDRELEHVMYMNQAMYNRRLRSYGGAWRKARTKLGQIQVEEMSDDAISEYGEVTDLSGRCPDCGSGTIAATLRWAGLRYEVEPEDQRVLPFSALLT